MSCDTQTSTTDTLDLVLVKIPNELLLPPSVARHLIDLLLPHMHNAVEVNWDGAIKYAKAPTIVLQPMTPAKLAKLSLDTADGL